MLLGPREQADKLGLATICQANRSPDPEPPTTKAARGRSPGLKEPADEGWFLRTESSSTPSKASSRAATQQTNAG